MNDERYVLALHSSGHGDVKIHKVETGRYVKNVNAYTYTLKGTSVTEFGRDLQLHRKVGRRKRQFSYFPFSTLKCVLTGIVGPLDGVLAVLGGRVLGREALVLASKHNLSNVAFTK